MNSANAEARTKANKANSQTYIKSTTDTNSTTLSTYRRRESPGPSRASSPAARASPPGSKPPTPRRGIRRAGRRSACTPRRASFANHTRRRDESKHDMETINESTLNKCSRERKSQPCRCADISSTHRRRLGPVGRPEALRLPHLQLEELPREVHVGLAHPEADARRGRRAGGVGSLGGCYRGNHHDDRTPLLSDDLVLYFAGSMIDDRCQLHVLH